jgi:chorismate mutase
MMLLLSLPKNDKIRANIDVLDANLLDLLGRMKIADEIGG